MEKKKRKQVALKMKKKSVLVIPKDKYYCFPGQESGIYRIPNTQVFPNNEEACFIFHPLLLCGSSGVVGRKRKMSVVRCLFLGYLISRKKVRTYLRVRLFATTFGFPKWEKMFPRQFISFEALWEGGNFPIRSDGDSLPNKYRYGPVNRLEFFFQWETKFKNAPGFSFFPFLFVFQFSLQEVKAFLIEK